MKLHSLASAVLLALLLGPGGSAAARPPVGIAYYDVDRLYDTVPAPFYDDGAFTPQGRLRWTSERYERKIRRTAAVIDSMALPLVALWGVENEQVVRDLAAACRGDYSYLHRTLNSLDGLDFALLYYGDVFYPYRAEPQRRALYIEGELGRDTVGLVLCADPRTAEWLLDDLREERPRVRLIVLGRTGSLDAPSRGLHDATREAAQAGRGTIRRNGRWEMRDRILVDTALACSRGDLFARRYLIDPRTGSPRPTYRRGVYCGGCSASLPVFVYLRPQKPQDEIGIP